jgi:hypothetical protein
MTTGATIGEYVPSFFEGVGTGFPGVRFNFRVAGNCEIAHGAGDNPFWIRRLSSGAEAAPNHHRGINGG